MRISDWSSDVCSSDLVPRLHPRGDAPHQVRARPQLRRLLRRVGDCVKDAGEGFDLHVVGVHCPAFQTFGRRADYSNSSEWVPARTKFTRRSEEHTSELQSLMRISYAVFCLKKKNIITRTQNNMNSTTRNDTKH